VVRSFFLGHTRRIPGLISRKTTLGQCKKSETLMIFASWKASTNILQSRSKSTLSNWVSQIHHAQLIKDQSLLFKPPQFEASVLPFWQEQNTLYHPADTHTFNINMILPWGERNINITLQLPNLMLISPLVPRTRHLQNQHI